MTDLILLAIFISITIGVNNIRNAIERNTEYVRALLAVTQDPSLVYSI